MAAHTAHRNGSGHNTLDDAHYGDGIQTPARSDAVAAPVSLGQLLLSHHQDPLQALAKLVTMYNTLLASSAAASAPSLHAERDRLIAENAKLWHWCSNLKKDQDRSHRDAKEAHSRIVDLETLLRANGLAVPLARTWSTPPITEADGSKRPTPVRSLSDGPPSARGQGPAPDDRPSLHVPPSTSSSSSDLGVPAAAAVPMVAPHSRIDDVADEQILYPRPHTQRRRLSSSDLDDNLQPETTTATSPRPDASSSLPKSATVRSLPPSTPGHSATEQQCVDERCMVHSSHSTVHSFTALPNVTPMSPLFPVTTPPHRSDSVSGVDTAAFGSSFRPLSPQKGARSPASTIGTEMHRQRSHSDAPAMPNSTSALFVAPLPGGTSRDPYGADGNPRAPPPADELTAIHSQQYTALSRGEADVRTTTQQPRTHREKRPPTLKPAVLPYVAVRVTTSSIKSDAKGREMLSFTLQVALQVPPEHDPLRKGGTLTWQVEKAYPDILALDTVVRSKNPRSQLKKLVALPDKSLFKDHAPSKVDQRKTSLQAYMQNLVAMSLPEKEEICAFLNSNIVTERNAPVSNPAHKAGHLTKKGRSFGGWQTRFYVLNGPELDYYENQGGPHLGSINLVDAQIGRQQHSGTASPDSYRHAFLIRERILAKDARSAKHEEHDHILCAESDEERDEWVRILAAWHSGEFVEPLDISPTPQAPGRQPARSLDADRSGSEAARILRKPSRDEPLRPHAANVDAKWTGSDFGGPGQFGQHVRQQSFGQASTASLGDEPAVRNKIYSQNSAQRARHYNDIPPSSSAPSALNEMAMPPQYAAQTPVTIIERPSSEDGRYATSSADFAERSSPPTVSHSRMPSLGLEEVLPRSSHSSSDASRPISPDQVRRYERHESSEAPKKSISAPKNAVPIGDGHHFKHAASHHRKDDDRKAKTKSSFWNFASRERRDHVEPPSISHPVFGVSLADAVALSRIRDDFELPAVVYRCIEHLEAKNAQMEEGIYRLSGSSNVIKSLKERFNREGDVNLLANGDYLDVHVVAGLLKTYLRELPEHILTNELHPRFLMITNEMKRALRINTLGTLISQLPTANYTLLRFLTAHLIHVVQNEATNKMTLRNLGIVFSPTLNLPATLFSMLLIEFDTVFAMDGDQPAPGKLDEPVETSPTIDDGNPEDNRRLRRRSRNSVMYEASGADKLLESLGGRLRSATEEDEHSTAFNQEEVFIDASDVSPKLLDEPRTAPHTPAIERSATAPRNVHHGTAHHYQERSKDLGLHIHAITALNGLSAPSSPHSPSAQSSPRSLRVPGSPIPAN